MSGDTNDEDTARRLITDALGTTDTLGIAAMLIGPDHTSSGQHANDTFQTAAATDLAGDPAEALDVLDRWIDSHSDPVSAAMGLCVAAALHTADVIEAHSPAGAIQIAYDSCSDVWHAAALVLINNALDQRLAHNTGLTDVIAQLAGELGARHILRT